MENFECGLENSNSETHMESSRNMEAERPFDGIEQPFIDEHINNITDLDSVDLSDSERPSDNYFPEESESFDTREEPINNIKQDKIDIKEDFNTDSEEKREGLTDEEKKELKEQTGWPDEIIDAIGSMEEAEIYQEAGLQVAEIDGKMCLIRSDIDFDQLDEDGISNRVRMEKGRPPITKDGQEVELHHIGQKNDGPLAELTTNEHRGNGNDVILHDKNKESEIDRNAFAKERKEHWKARANS